MKLIKQLALVFAVGVSLSANALTITPASSSWSGNETANLDEVQISAILNANGFGPVSLTELYKQDVGAGSDSRSFASSYQTTFSNTPSDPQDADIVYAGSPAPALTGIANLWLYVKDGNNEPSYYLINLNLLGWNGTDTLELRSFWPAGGAISHVTILGGGTPPPSVPDGGLTVALLGAGLAIVGSLRRFIKP
jgi:hypothetical protein